MASLRRVRLGIVLSFCVTFVAALYFDWHAADLVMALVLSSLASAIFIVLLFVVVAIVAPRRAGLSVDEARSLSRIPKAMVVGAALLVATGGFHVFYAAWVWGAFSPGNFPDINSMDDDLELMRTVVELGFANYWPVMLATLVDQSFEVARELRGTSGIWSMRTLSLLLALQLIMPVILVVGYLFPHSVLVGPLVLVLCLPIEASVWTRLRKYFDLIL